MSLAFVGSLLIVGGLQLVDLSDVFANAPIVGAAHVVLLVSVITAVERLARRRRLGVAVGCVTCAVAVLLYAVGRATGWASWFGELSSLSGRLNLGAATFEVLAIGIGLTILRRERSI